MNRLFTFLFLLLALSGISQIRITGFVTDSSTRHPVAFVAVSIENQTSACLTDIDGKFIVQADQFPVKIHFSLIGYARKTVVLESLIQKPLEVQLSPRSMGLKEVEIKAGENPAHRIVKTTFARRKLHDPLLYEPWKCNVYQKLTLTGTPDSTWKPEMPDDLKKKASIDSLFDAQHLFLIESHSVKFFKDGMEREEVLASKVSGLKDPSVFLLALRFQPFSCYSAQLNLSGIDYVNPISKNSEELYSFDLRDTLFEGKDTLYVISFKPKKNKIFKGIEGLVYISAPDYAIRSFSASPSVDETNAASLKIRQQYHRLADGTWFPEQINTWLEFGNIKLQGSRVTAEVKSYVSNAQLRLPLKKSDFDEINLEINPDGMAKSEVYWDSVRSESLSQRDIQTYRILDSISRANNLDLKMKALESLVQMRVPVKFIDIDLRRVLLANRYETVRLGAGILTNNKFSKVFAVGGFAGYGFGDKAWKYGGEFRLYLYRKKDVQFRASWSLDLRETGGTHWVSDYRYDRQEYIRQLMVNRMNREEITRVSLKGRILKYVVLEGFGGTTHLTHLHNYRYRNLPANHRFTWIETGLNLTWIPGERFYRNGNLKLALEKKYPEFRLLINHAQSAEPNSPTFNQVQGQIDYQKKFRRIGTSSLRLLGALTDRDAPYGRIFTARSNLNNSDRLKLAAGASLETLEMNRIVCNQYLAGFFVHDFGPLFNFHDFKPSFALALNAMVGRFQNPENHQFLDNELPEIPRNGYFETGLMINNLLEQKSAASGYGIGGFYRFGSFAQSNWKKNLVLKLTFSIPF